MSVGYQKTESRGELTVDAEKCRANTDDGAERRKDRLQ